MPNLALQDVGEVGAFESSFFVYNKEEIVMLVLGRKPGEYVMIGKDIMVKVVKSDDGDLRLAINAPRDINIIRGEIYEDKLKYIPRSV